MYKYKLILRFAFPSTAAPASFQEKRNELESAVNIFNDKFLGRKEIEILELDSVAIINLITLEPVKNPTREISAFSQILKYDFQWEKFTQNKNRMFEVTLKEGPSSLNSKVENGEINVTNVKETLKGILGATEIEDLEIMIQDLRLLLNIAESKKVILEAEKIINDEKEN
jgi:hypothetical protein